MLLGLSVTLTKRLCEWLKFCLRDVSCLIAVVVRWVKSSEDVRSNCRVLMLVAGFLGSSQPAVPFPPLGSARPGSSDCTAGWDAAQPSTPIISECARMEPGFSRTKRLTCCWLYGKMQVWNETNVSREYSNLVNNVTQHCVGLFYTNNCSLKLLSCELRGQCFLPFGTSICALHCS